MESTAVIKGNGNVSGHDTNGNRYTTVNGQVIGIDTQGRVTTGNNRSSSNQNGASQSNSGRYGNISCHLCHGSGVCATCGGDCIADSPYGGTYVCPNCDNGKCRKCKGSGKIYGLKSTEGVGW